MFAVKLEGVWAPSEHLDDVPDLMAAQACDAVIIDCLMFGALASAEKLKLRAAALVHSAPGALMPPGGPFEAQLLAPVNRVREQAGLCRIDNLWQAWACFPALSNSIRELDPVSSQVPESIRYCGPMDGQAAPSEWMSPWPPGDTRPLVLVSFSTGPYWDQSSRILRTLEAFSEGPYRVLITAGQARIERQLVPTNAIVVERAPHEAILPKAALTITHAGHGTVLASLRHGVPLLCLPNPVADQPILARQVAALGCGLSLDGETAAPGAIRAAVEQLLRDKSCAANSRRLAALISQSAGVSAAVSHLEQTLGLSKMAPAVG
jgi:UDP:flavonoid glycosyltransferase YjiC (YdhE family)